MSDDLRPQDWNGFTPDDDQLPADPAQAIVDEYNRRFIKPAPRADSSAPRADEIARLLAVAIEKLDAILKHLEAA